MVIAAIVGALVVTVVPAGAAGTLDQAQTGSIGSECVCGPFALLAQTFTAGITGDLDQVDLLLYRAGNPGTLTVEIRPVSDGVPTSTVLATAAVPEGSVIVAQPAWVSVPFPAPAASTAGTQYAIVVSAPGSDGMSIFYGWDVALGNPYAEGAALTNVNSGATWLGLAEHQADRAFRTYVAPSAAGPSVSGRGRFGTDGDGAVSFTLSNEAVSFERIRGQRFTFRGETASVTGSGETATLTGTGTWDGSSGYAWEIKAVDKGGWGRLEDTIQVVIRDRGGATVFTSFGPQQLKQGDLDVTSTQ